ncbi:hypothetical protein PLICRDRAFT_560346 [Plicaturopsis crispa FD-325 SS-3]|nr:hypothetical protein PLICRDRAFT_560346 [Plicaturopsis crispa FD-325 SS-3]
MRPLTKRLVYFCVICLDLISTLWRRLAKRCANLYERRTHSQPDHRSRNLLPQTRHDFAKPPYRASLGIENWGVERARFIRKPSGPSALKISSPISFPAAEYLETSMPDPALLATPAAHPHRPPADPPVCNVDAGDNSCLAPSIAMPTPVHPGEPVFMASWLDADTEALLLPLKAAALSPLLKEVSRTRHIADVPPIPVFSRTLSAALEENSGKRTSNENHTRQPLRASGGLKILEGRRPLSVLTNVGIPPALSASSIASAASVYSIQSSPQFSDRGRPFSSMGDPLLASTYPADTFDVPYPDVFDWDTYARKSCCSDPRLSTYAVDYVRTIHHDDGTYKPSGDFSSQLIFEDLGPQHRSSTLSQRVGSASGFVFGGPHPLDSERRPSALPFVTDYASPYSSPIISLQSPKRPSLFGTFEPRPPASLDSSVDARPSHKLSLASPPAVFFPTPILKVGGVDDIAMRLDAVRLQDGGYKRPRVKFAV